MNLDNRTRRILIGAGAVLVIVGAIAKKPLEDLGLDLSTDTILTAAGGIGALASLLGWSAEKDTPKKEEDTDAP